MDEFALLIDLHREGKRQGPGGAAQTRRAIELSGLHAARGLKIADIGCGTGASTLVLAQELDASVIAVDFILEFLQRLDIAAKEQGLGDRIATLSESMDSLPFGENSLDAIWSEGAIYNMGFRKGIEAWRRFLKPNAILAVSELTWLTRERPAELEHHWQEHYPEVDTASAKISLLEEYGYSPIGYFPLPCSCWLDNYYRPLQARFAEFLSRNGNTEAARATVADEEKEISLYERYSAYVSYGFYVARKVND